MAKTDITKVCGPCGGTGYSSGSDSESGDPITNPCNKCLSVGFLVTGQIDGDLVELIESTKDKVDWIKKNVKEILQHFDIEEKE